MATLNDVLTAFQGATQVSAPTLAGSLLVICAGVGGVLAVAWVFQVSREAVRGSLHRAPLTLLFIVAAFAILISAMGVFYQ